MHYKGYAYIDLGAYTGDTIRQFMSNRKLPVPASKFEIWAFEPNPNCYKELKKLTDEMDNFKGFSPCAAWIKDEYRDFAVDNTKNPFGSSLMPSKQDYSNFEKIQVRCIDFSRFLKEFPDYYIIVKMDVEGAEFKILPHLINEGTHKLINELWLETHPNKVKEYTTTQSNALFKRLKQDIFVKEWS